MYFHGTNLLMKMLKQVTIRKVGKVRAVTTDYIQIQKGTLDKKYYFVPKHYIQGYDGDDIWLALTEDEVKQFESEKEMPLSVSIMPSIVKENLL